jgi:hypothetical protein
LLTRISPATAALSLAHNNCSRWKRPHVAARFATAGGRQAIFSLEIN